MYWVWKRVKGKQLDRILNLLAKQTFLHFLGLMFEAADILLDVASVVVVYRDKDLTDLRLFYAAFLSSAILLSVVVMVKRLGALRALHKELSFSKMVRMSPLGKSLNASMLRNNATDSTTAGEEGDAKLPSTVSGFSWAEVKELERDKQFALLNFLNALVEDLPFLLLNTAAGFRKVQGGKTTSGVVLLIFQASICSSGIMLGVRLMSMRLFFLHKKFLSKCAHSVTTPQNKIP